MDDIHYGIIMGGVGALMIMGVILVFNQIITPENNEMLDVNSLFCCPKGNSCSGTLYDYKRDECILTMCQNNPLMKNCTYKPYR